MSTFYKPLEVCLDEELTDEQIKLFDKAIHEKLKDWEMVLDDLAVESGIKTDNGVYLIEPT